MPSSGDASWKIDGFLADLPEWQQVICARLRSLIRQADPAMTEEWREKTPAFSRNGLVCSIQAAEDRVTLTFHQGALLEDTETLFTDEGSDDRSRAVHFAETDEVPDQTVVNYLKKAVANNLSGKKIIG